MPNISELFALSCLYDRQLQHHCQLEHGTSFQSKSYRNTFKNVHSRSSRL